MKNSVLIELAKRWEEEARTPECNNGAPEAAIGNAEAHGRRQGMRDCADALRMLVDLLGSKDDDDRLTPVIKRRDG
jgi:hypothetical protein